MESIQKLSAVTIRLKIEAQLPEGEVQDSVNQEFEFIYGVEHQVPTLEKALEGAAAGYQFSLTVPPR